MTPDRALRVAVEAAVVRGWPASETAAIDGWLARFATGSSVRANTVAAHVFHGNDVGAAIDRVEAFYRARGAQPRFTITDVSAPHDLDDMLAHRGYLRSADHVTMMKAVAATVERSGAAAPIDVMTSQATTPEWYAVYLQGLSEDRRAVAPQMVERVPRPRVFFSAGLDGAVVGSALSVVDGDLASVQCMATLEAARRQGTARAVLAAIERTAAASGARWLYLQTEAGNDAAVRLYASAGFVASSLYHTRDAPM